jgi:hypothetical protein
MPEACSSPFICSAAAHGIGRAVCVSRTAGRSMRFPDPLVDEGFVVLGGPTQGDREILHAIAASSEEAVRGRLAQDNGAQDGMLTVTSVEAWTTLPDGPSA